MQFNRLETHKHLNQDLKGRIISLYEDCGYSFAQIVEICNVSVSDKKIVLSVFLLL